MPHNLACFYEFSHGKSKITNWTEAEQALALGAQSLAGSILLVNYDHPLGPDLLKRARQEPGTPITVIMVSDLPDAEAEALCKQMSLHSYMKRDSVLNPMLLDLDD